MSHPASPTSIEALNRFKYEKTLKEDPITHSLTLLGTLPAPGGAKTVQAIVRVEKTALSSNYGQRLFGEDGLIRKAVLEESTDIYTWLFGWLSEDREQDIKINVICPATDVHIRKYAEQERIMVRETPELYEKYVKPYITAFPASRTKWVENILTGISEQDKILYSCPDFLILPDMKWDLKTLSSLYLVAIVQDRTIRSIRDLHNKHVGTLKGIRREATRIVQERWGLFNGSLRMYIHYQPSYYHFHVHIVNANYEGSIGMAVGQAHLLDDIISLLELDTDDHWGIFQKMTITYGLGDQHGLFPSLKHSSSLVSGD